MKQNKRNKALGFNTEKMVTGAVMTALVIIMQLLGSFTTFFGPFSTAVALIPIVVGAALCGVGIGAWLGFIFGVVVLVSGGATFFLTYNVVGTIITVLVKGTACGLCAGLTFKLLSRVNEYLAVIAAALVCPVVNTGVFLGGCALFFMKDVELIASELKIDNSGFLVFIVLAANFFIEIAVNLLCAPVILKLINIKKNSGKKKDS